MKAAERLWRTTDGGLVADGDPAAATLAYTAGDDVRPADEARLPGAGSEPKAPKAAAKPADKSRRPSGNKRA